MAGVKAAVALAIFGSVQGARISKRQIPQCGVKGDGISTRNGTSISIVNGQDASECEWKWQVGFWEKAPKRYSSPFCGGTLIAPEWVLTAAHCGSEANFFVVAGDYNTNKPNPKRMQVRSADAVINHPQYNDKTMDYDFSLIKVNESFEMTSCVGTACLPSGSGDDVPDESTCWTTGWGTLSSGADSQPTILQEAAVKTIGNNKCKKTSYKKKQITKSMLCAQGKTSGDEIIDACQGDSGGPLVCETDGRWTLHGATSWGKGCAEKGYPGIWARVSEVTDWVNDVMTRIVEKPQCPSWCDKTDCWYSGCRPCC